MDSPIIRIQNLTKRFGGILALDTVSLDIHEGELFGLLGPNGAGKTTLISILSTILPASSGEGFVCGFDSARQQDEVRQSIGIVFQDPSLDDELTGAENLDFHGRLYGMGRAARQERMEDVLRLVDLEDRKDDVVKTYSGGMRRRLEIARGLMHHPRVLFLDEPTLGLDPQTRRRIWNYIRGLNDSLRMTIILTTHYMDEADQLCSRIGIIDRGRIVALDSPEKLKQSLGGDLVELGIGSHDDSFVHQLSFLEGVSNVSALNGRLTMNAAHGENLVPRLFDEAHARGVDISSVSVRKPNLEDVFINLTGREMRDEPVKSAKDRIRIYLSRRKR